MKEAGLPTFRAVPNAIHFRRRGLGNSLARSGYPVMVKASAGGGGRGMRIVRYGRGTRPSTGDCVTREAAAAFKDGSVYIERYVEQPRHIEIQVLADEHGECIHLGERECSIQRRHQKLMEEAPSPVLTPELRNNMGDAAVCACKKLGYSSAGTVEFLLDAHGKFYFMEMNTRIQVEHPVTEMVTLADIVRNQIRIAEGEPLGYTQDDLLIVGHAIECRINAENPETFAPSPGRSPPSTFRAVRAFALTPSSTPVTEFSPFYDSMIAKVIVHARTRETWRSRA